MNNRRTPETHKRTLFQGERKISVLVGYSVVFMVHVFGIYWWNRKDDLFHSLFMVPPETVPPFWHAIFIILVNGMNLRACYLYMQ